MMRMSDKRLLAAAEADVDAALAGGFVGCPVIVVVGPKGGGTKTTTSASLLHQLGMGDRVAGMLLGVDANPDVGDLLEKLGVRESRAQRRFTDYALEPGVVQRPADWGYFVDVIGRVHVLHNQGVPSSRIEQVEAGQYIEALSWARQFAAMMVVDGGTSLLHPSSVATVGQATSLVIATRADPLALNKSSQSIAEMVAAGFGDLVARSTVVLTETDKNANVAEYGKGRDFLAARVARVIVVPYDSAAGAVGAVRWKQLKLATRLALTEVLASVLGDVRGRTGLMPAAGPSVHGQLVDAGAAWPGRGQQAHEAYPTVPGNYTPQPSYPSAGDVPAGQVPQVPAQVAPPPPPAGPETAVPAAAPLPSWVRMP